MCEPCSKLGFCDWWAKTAGDRWLRIGAGALDHRRFWDAMDAISEAQLQEIERRLVAQMIETFGIDLLGLVLAMTKRSEISHILHQMHVHRSEDSPSSRSNVRHALGCFGPLGLQRPCPSGHPPPEARQML